MNSAPLIPPAAPLPDAILSETLDAARLAQVIDFRDWLLIKGAETEATNTILSGFAERLNGLGVPVDRIFSVIETLHSEYAGIGRSWTKEAGASTRYLPHGERRETVYKVSPFAHVNRTGQWLLLDLATVPDDLFPIIPELKAGGYRHYLTIPVRFTIGSESGISFATRTPGGFGPQELKILSLVMPTFARVTELRALKARLDTVLRIYVGDEPHRAILSGAIVRGQVSRIRSAILFADMRDYTRISAVLSPEDAVDLLNNLFDCLVPPIEEEGGEVLKYLGDGLLAIFRDRGDDMGGAAQSALTAASNALQRIVTTNAEGRFLVPVSVGIALHHGDAAYGNVGSGQRLDFTVIGRDVNLANRLAKLNKKLGEPLLMTKPFVERLWGDPEPLGAHELDGFDEKIEVYRP
jgi:adenylate cyclase